MLGPNFITLDSSNNRVHSQACLTLICTIMNITSTNPSTYEILFPDSIQVGIWVGAIIDMAMFISDTDSFGSCARVSSVLKSSCAVSQLILWAGVALVYVKSEMDTNGERQLNGSNYRHVSLTKLAIAFYVRRLARQSSSQQPDCEKVLPPLQSL